METMISLSDMMLLLLTIAGVAALVVISIAMSKVGSLAGRLKQTLDENKQAIRDTVKAMPPLIKDAGEAVANTKKTLNTVLPRCEVISGNVEAMTTDGRAAVNTVKQVSEVIGNGVRNTVNVVQEGMQETADGVRLIAELIRMVISMFS